MPTTALVIPWSLDKAEVVRGRGDEDGGELQLLDDHGRRKGGRYNEDGDGTATEGRRLAVKASGVRPGGRQTPSRGSGAPDLEVDGAFVVQHGQAVRTGPGGDERRHLCFQ